MNYFLFDRQLFNANYNCSYYDINLHTIEERTNIGYGIGLILLSVIFLCLYAPLLIVLWQPYFQQESCYRLMSIIVIIDIIAIFISGIFAGYFSIIGAVYCTCPWIMLIFGTLGFFVWIAESDLAIILALNRCTCIISATKTTSIFSGYRTYLWVSLALGHAFIVCLSTNGLIYSSIFGVWIFNPHAGYPQNGFNYANKWQPFHNVGVAFLLAIFYLIFVFNLIRKKYYSSDKSVFSAKQKPIFFQVLIVSLLNFFIAILYVYEQYFPTPKILMAASEVGWLCIHGIPAVIYPFLNKSIRKRVMKLIFKTPYFGSSSPNIVQDGGHMSVINSNLLVRSRTVTPNSKTV